MSGQARSSTTCTTPDRDGNLVDVYLSETRDRAAAEAFFRSARTVTEVVPAPGSPSTDTTPIPEPSELSWVTQSRTARTVT